MSLQIPEHLTEDTIRSTTPAIAGMMSSRCARATEDIFSPSPLKRRVSSSRNISRKVRSGATGSEQTMSRKKALSSGSPANLLSSRTGHRASQITTAPRIISRSRPGISTAGMMERSMEISVTTVRTTMGSSVSGRPPRSISVLM